LRIKMMKVWIASFLVLFGLAEIYQWLQHFTLPLPVYILGGAFLAIASNYEKITGFPFQKTPKDNSTIISSQQPVIPTVNQSQLNPPASPITTNAQQPRLLSFTIKNLAKNQSKS